jgi:hypothetical protein
MTNVRLFLDYFLLGQEGLLPPDQVFGFNKIYAGTKPIPVERSQELSRNITTRHDRETWELHFDKPPTRSHARLGMIYPADSEAYAEFLADEDDRASLNQCEVPAEWNELPAAGPQHPPAVIADEEKERIADMASILPEDDRLIIARLIAAINEHQAHLPYSVSIVVLVIFDSSNS